MNPLDSVEYKINQAVNKIVTLREFFQEFKKNIRLSINNKTIKQTMFALLGNNYLEAKETEKAKFGQILHACTG